MHGEKYFHFDALLGLNGVTDTISEFGSEHNFTALVPKYVYSILNYYYCNLSNAITKVGERGSR